MRFKRSMWEWTTGQRVGAGELQGGRPSCLQLVDVRPLNRALGLSRYGRV